MTNVIDKIGQVGFEIGSTTVASVIEEGSLEQCLRQDWLLVSAQWVFVEWTRVNQWTHGGKGF